MTIELPTEAEYRAAIAAELSLKIFLLGRTRTNLALASGIEFQSLGRYFHGKRAIPSDTLAIICRALPITMVELWNNVELRVTGRRDL